MLKDFFTIFYREWGDGEGKGGNVWAEGNGVKNDECMDAPRSLIIFNKNIIYDFIKIESML